MAMRHQEKRFTRSLAPDGVSTISSFSDFARQELPGDERRTQGRYRKKIGWQSPPYYYSTKVQL